MKLYTILLFIVVTYGLGLPADGQGVSLPTLSPLRSVPVDTSRFQLVMRSEYMKLELARKTLLALNFTDADAVIQSQAKVIQECEKTLSDVVKRTDNTIRELRDSLKSTTVLIQQGKQTTERIITTTEQTQVRLSNFSGLVKDARRYVWVQRAGAFAVGTGFGLLLPSLIKLIGKGL